MFHEHYRRFKHLKIRSGSAQNDNITEFLGISNRQALIAQTIMILFRVGRNGDHCSKFI